MKLVTFRRSGTNLLVRMLKLNFELPDFSESHSKLPEGGVLTVYRPVFPVMVSLWKMRERVGIHSSVQFAEFLREPFDTLMDVGTPTVRVVEDGKVREMPYHRPDASVPAPRWWLNDSSRFLERAVVAVAYSDLLERPLDVLDACEVQFSLRRLGPVQLVRGQVGWWPATHEEPHVDETDLRLLQNVQDEFDG